MIAVLRRFFEFEMTIAEWIGTAILAAIPYLAIGVLWSVTHTDALAGQTGVGRAVSFLGPIVSWPVSVFSDVCTA